MTCKSGTSFICRQIEVPTTALGSSCPVNRDPMKDDRGQAANFGLGTWVQICVLPEINCADFASDSLPVPQFMAYKMYPQLIQGA